MILLPTGYDFAKWMVDMDMENIYKFSKDFTFNVHSANPVGKANIESYLNNYLSFRKNIINMNNIFLVGSVRNSVSI